MALTTRFWKFGFLYRIGIAGSRTVFHPGAATPHGGMFASVVPCDSTENVTALGAVHDAGKCILATVNTLFSFLPAVKVGTSYHLFLNLHIKVAGDNGFVAVLYIILRNNAVIRHTLFLQKIHCIGF